MSRPGQPPAHIDPAEQIASLLNLYRDRVHPATLARLDSRVRELGLSFSADEVTILAALDTPARVQEFLNTQVYYNNDHASPDLEETAMPPRQVLRTGIGHCFEGAMFAYAVDYIHGHRPLLMLLEASQDSEHNLVLFQDPQTGRYGCNAHSSFKNLDGRPAEYTTLRALAESYYPYYYSDRSNDPKDLTLVGYSDPFDLTAKFGVRWMDSVEPLWDLYYTYVDSTLTFHYLFDDSPEPHPYALVRALREGWIQIDGQGRPSVCVERLPPEALAVWHEFWRVYDRSRLPPYGLSREIEQKFMRLTGTTPIDLVENADDLQYFLAGGYRIEQLLGRDEGSG
jgi:hypothetical protein